MLCNPSCALILVATSEGLAPRGRSAADDGGGDGGDGQGALCCTGSMRDDAGKIGWPSTCGMLWLVLALPECRIDPWARSGGLARNLTPYVASQTSYVKGSSLVFVHLSKCAGTTFKRALATAARRAGLDRPFTLFRKTWPKFLQACASNGRDCARDLYVGTNSFGACDYVQRECTYVTILRHPMQRLVSSWRYFCVKGAENKKGWVDGKCDLSLVDWARLQPSLMTFELSTNQAPIVQTNRSDCPLLAVPAIGDTHLAAALTNVQGAVHAIVAERLASGLRYLERSLGLPLDADNAAATHDNANSDPTVVAQAADLRHILRYDLALYSAVLNSVP